MAEPATPTDNSQSQISRDAETEQVFAFVKDLVNQYAEDAFKKQQTVTDPAAQQQQLLRDTLQPVIGQDLNDAKFAAADARDYVAFYHNNPIADEYQSEVEAAFAQAKQNNRPVPRAEVLNWVIGKERLSDPKKFAEKESARQKRDLDIANMGVDIGSGGLSRQKAETTFSNFDKMSLAEMEKALEGITF